MSDTGRKEDAIGIDDGPKAGTPKTPGGPARPAPGGDDLTARDVAPNRGRGKWGLIVLLAIIVVIVVGALIWADDAPDLGDAGGDATPEGVVIPAD